MTAFNAGLPRQLLPQEFVGTFFSGGQTVASGASGRIITLSAPKGRRVKLMHLATSTATELLTIRCDGVIVFQANIGNGNQSAIVGRQVYSNGAGGSIGSAQLPFVGPAKVITVDCSVATTNQIHFSYEYGK